MKLNIKLIFVIVILALSYSTLEASKNLRLLKKNKNKDAATCPKVLKDPNDKKSEEVDLGTNVFPADVQSSNKVAKDNAILQTKAARNLFYNVPKSVLAVLQKVASNYAKFHASIKANKDEDPFDILGKVQRQTSVAGTWQVFTALQKELGITASTFHEDVIARISAGKDILPRDLLGFLGYLGDIGASLQDSINRDPNPVKEENDKIQNIKTVLTKYFGDDLVTKSKTFYSLYSPDTYYDVKDGTDKRSKKGDRMFCSAGVGTKKTDKRSGVLNVGKDADKDITVGSGKASELSDDKKLPEVGWPWQTVPKSFVEKVSKDEPWAGHYSGSLYELILMLELFDRTDPKKDDSATLSKDQKNIYAGLASSFLIATGMHSAVEVVYVDKLYTGTPVTPKVITDSTFLSDATKVVTGIISGLK